MSQSTVHTIHYQRADTLEDVGKSSVNLVITSPPYPMVSMWDGAFSDLNPEIGDLLKLGDGRSAYDLMHRELEKTWKALGRVVDDGGFVCINIGDAARKVGEEFSLYPSHTRIVEYMQNLGFLALPGIIWRKPSNSPNKFMGSGMLPAGAYVTMEHEYILIFRKKGKRTFSDSQEKERRRCSSYFWEERNHWFSDLWQDLHGIRQGMLLKKGRARSGAFPLDLPLRIISMFSLRGDTVLDPYLGTGTTSLASILLQRNSIGYEMDGMLSDIVHGRVMSAEDLSASYVRDRLKRHEKFVEEHVFNGNKFKYFNEELQVPVKDRSEQYIELSYVNNIEWVDEEQLYRAYHMPVRRSHQPL